SDTMAVDIAMAARTLAAARRVLVLTGAGLSADSGMPTYRGVGGLYDDADVDEGVPIAQALSGEMFARRPAWPGKYIGRIERACVGARPNRGLAVLARLLARFAHVYIMTEDIVGFHAGACSRDVIEMHGNIQRLQCSGCERRIEVADYA